MKTVLMRSHLFKVVGVIKERMPTGGTGGSQAAEDYNRDIYLPLRTSVRRFGEIISIRTAGSRVNEKIEYSQVTLTVSDTDKVRPVGDAIRQILEQRHAGKKDWLVTVPLDKLEESRTGQGAVCQLTDADCLDIAVGRRHRHHEHHARDRDGTNA